MTNKENQPGIQAAATSVRKRRANPRKKPEAEARMRINPDELAHIQQTDKEALRGGCASRERDVEPAPPPNERL